jgi:membrane-associated HD superfamily phosphohydrolase
VKKGDQQHDSTVSDMEFRYPGPKPRSKEAAIVMLCDIVESACRSLAEPNASRIESKVRELAKMRLEDGQFEECDLTLRDLNLIEQAINKTLLSIYHGRIVYPSPEAAATAGPVEIVSPTVAGPKASDGGLKKLG